MSTITCRTMLNCRRADALSIILSQGADFARTAHEVYGCDSDIMPAVEAALKGYVREMAGYCRRQYPDFAPEELAIQVSEFRVAIRQAMAILFPVEEE